MDELIMNCFDKAKYIAMKYVKDIDIAEDIAQLASIQLYLNNDKIDNSKVNSWLFTVTHNLCMDYFKKNKNNREILVDPLEVSQHYAPEENKIHEELDIDAYDFISASDKKILKKYYNENVPLAKLAQDFKIKSSCLKSRIYSLSNEIKLFHLITSDVICFKPLPATKLTKNLNKFISVLLKALRNNDLGSMKRYCKDAIIHQSIAKIKIKSYETCKIQIDGVNEYRLIIAYLDFQSKIGIFDIRFLITDSRNIQVVEMPIFHKQVLVIDKKYIDPKNAEKELLTRKGLYNNKLGSVEEMKAKRIVRVIQTRDDFGEE